MPQPRSMPVKIDQGYNNSGSTIGAKLAVRRSGAGDDQIALPSAGTDPILGITGAPITTGYLGDVISEGLAIGTSGAAIAAGARLEATAAGKLVTRTTGSLVGIANTAATATDQDIEVHLAGPGDV